jgi:hypothetical protein
VSSAGRTGSSGPLLGGLVGEVAGVLRRHKVAAVLPAIVLGAGADALELLRHDLSAQIAIGLLLALLFELYVGYAELLMAADHEREPVRMRVLLRRATRATPPLVGASLIAVSIPLAATGLLVLPGLWLMTIWSLFAPAIVHERLRPRAALSRSAALVRGAFWAVAASVTVAVLVEHAVIHSTAHSTEPVFGSQWLALVITALAVGLVSPPAAFTISLVYERLLAAEQPRISSERTLADGPLPGAAPPPSRSAASSRHAAGRGR